MSSPFGTAVDSVATSRFDWTIGSLRRTLASMHDTGVTPRETIDLRGLKCPLPVLRTRRILDRLKSGDVIAVVCTDPLAGIDLPNLLRETADSLLQSERAGKEWRFLIRKG